MCFSATASFTAAVVLGIIGIGCQILISVKAKTTMSFSERNYLRLFAALPLLFASHQISEGFVWLDPHRNLTAIRVFAYTAYTFWPLYITISTALIERSKQNHKRQPPHLPLESNWIVARWRRLIPPSARLPLLVLNLFFGIGLYIYCTWCLVVEEPLHVRTEHDRLEYKSCIDHSVPPFLALGRMIYVGIIVSSFALSSIQYSLVVAAGVLASASICYMLWQSQFESTWCYFAALVSSLAFYCTYKELEAYPEDDDVDAEPDHMQPQVVSLATKKEKDTPGDEEKGPQANSIEVQTFQRNDPIKHCKF